MSSPNSPRATAASAAPAPGLEADDLRRPNADIDDDDDDDDRPATPLPSGREGSDVDSRHARGYPRRGRPESDTSSRKSARSAWRKKERLDKEKNEKGKDRFHARGGQPPIVPSYRGHADTQTFQAFERRVEIWMSRAESFIPPDEMGLALLDALHGAEPGTYLAGKDWRTFKVDNGVEILMNLLRPHYEADKLQIQARVLNDYSSWCRSTEESIAHALLRFESLRDRVVQSGLAIPDQGQEDAQRCTSLFAKLGLSKAQVREMMTNCNLKYDYETLCTPSVCCTLQRIESLSRLSPL
jgi:hypothetical protein